jgi:hypothetical protein
MYVQNTKKSFFVRFIAHSVFRIEPPLSPNPAGKYGHTLYLPAATQTEEIGPVDQSPRVLLRRAQEGSKRETF